MISLRWKTNIAEGHLVALQSWENMNKVETLFLLRPDRAGDAIKTLPVLRALRALYPEKDLHLVASEHNGSLFALEPGVTLHTLPKHWKRMKPESLSQIFRSKPYAGPLTKAVNLVCDPSDGVDLLLNSIQAEHNYTAHTALTGANIHRLEFPESTPANRNETENIALLLGQVFESDLTEKAYEMPTSPIFSEGDRNEALDKMGPKKGLWVGFCPVASTDRRTPPAKRWAKFIDKVSQQIDFDRFFLFGTPADYAYLVSLRQGSPKRDRIEFCFPSSFRTLGAYLDRLDGAVCVDSGPLHLARSMGVKSLGILSGCDTQRWFHELKSGEQILRRGIFARFPTVLEMVWAFEKWSPVLEARQSSL